MKNKINAFTLAEILIVVVIIGVVSVTMLRALKMDNTKTKQFQAGAYKVTQEFQSALMKVREIETSKVPTGNFTAEIMNDEEYALYSANETLADTDDLLEILQNYLRLDSPGLNFCSYTTAFDSTYCSGTTIKGARIVGDMYIGLEVIADTSNGELVTCPSYYRVNPNVEVAGSGKCWGRLYLDTNGNEPPNVYGQDAFVFGLNKNGVVY